MSSIIVFGAGASYGAGNIIPSRPPLGAELYTELSKNFPRSWGALPEDAKDEFEINFERGMSVIWDKYSSAVLELMRHMALYFAQFRPKQPNSTPYASLASEIQQRKLNEKVVAATLNYECLLELEFSHAGIEISYSLEEVPKGVIKVLKPHGSCNFIPKGISGPKGSIQIGRGAAIDMPVQVLGSMNEVIKHVLTQALPPIMCLYMEGKPTQVAAGTIKAVQKNLQDEISEAKVVVVVGVHPNPKDTYIWDSIASCAGEVGYVGPSFESFTQWTKEFRPQGNSIYLSESFESGTVQIANFIERRENVS